MSSLSTEILIALAAVLLLLIAGGIVFALRSRSQRRRAESIPEVSRLPAESSDDDEFTSADISSSTLDSLESLEIASEPGEIEEPAPEAEMEADETEVREIHEEVETLASETGEVEAEVEAGGEIVPRATLRQAPRRKRQPRAGAADEALDHQISDLDHRLDALEALVASIEQSLADFEPLLAEEHAGDEIGAGENPAGQAQAA